jgi:pimeloyl-ACP methyl ester carboxylesterase
VYNLGAEPTIESFPADYATYAMDFRGFGTTPCDASGHVSPSKCVSDIDSVVNHLCELHSCDKVTVLGWSQGALTAQLYAQASPSKVDKLVLYASIYDPELTYQRPAVFSASEDPNPRKANTMTSALEDFTLPGTIDQVTAMSFADLALAVDPIKAHWSQLHEFNLLSPAQIQVPTLMIAGALDPYCPQRNQAALFTRIPQDVDKSWVQLAGSDHGAHMLGSKQKWLQAVVAFIDSSGEGVDSSDALDSADMLGELKGKQPFFETHGRAAGI